VARSSVPAAQVKLLTETHPRYGFEKQYHVLVHLAFGQFTAAFAGSAPPNRAVYLLSEPILFVPECEEIPVACVVVDFSGVEKTPSVNKAKIRIGDSKTEISGNWKSVNGLEISEKSEFDRIWDLMQRPGLKKGAEKESVATLRQALAAVSDSSSVIVADIPKPKGAELGDVYEVSVEVSLDSGETLTVAGTAATMSLTAPSGWIAGDAHMHTDVGSDGWGMIYTVPKARSLGHKYMYLTDHVDMLLSGIGWNLYSTVAQNWSDSDLSLFPGLEVTLADGAGDCLGYGLPPTDDPDDPVLMTIVNRQDDAPTVISKLHDIYGAAAAVAHPDGPGIKWIPKGTGYDAVQVVDGPGESFWRASMSVYPYTCRPAAIGGSDFHAPLINSIGAVTWVNAVPASNWLTRKSLVDYAIREGRTCASSEGSFASLYLGTHAPGEDVSVPLGTTLTPKITVGAMYLPTYPNVTVSWRLYGDSTQIRSGSLSFSEGSYLRTISPASVTISSSSKDAYSIVVDFEYRDVYGHIFLDTAYCGPIYIRGY
jgi:hypothetical protein